VYASEIETGGRYKVDRSFANSNGPDGHSLNTGNSISGPYDAQNINGVSLNGIPGIWDGVIGPKGNI
jgi:hypothetical protein